MSECVPEVLIEVPRFSEAYSGFTATIAGFAITIVILLITLAIQAEQDDDRREYMQGMYLLLLSFVAGFIDSFIVGTLAGYTDSERAFAAFLLTIPIISIQVITLVAGITFSLAGANLTSKIGHLTVFARQMSNVFVIFVLWRAVLAFLVLTEDNRIMAYWIAGTCALGLFGFVFRWKPKLNIFRKWRFAKFSTFILVSILFYGIVQGLGVLFEIEIQPWMALIMMAHISFIGSWSITILPKQ